MTDATVVIKGRNELGLAVKQAERQLQGLMRSGELLGKFFRGGAIVGAVIAFERLAESAEQAALKIGDQGTARSLRELNREIDNLKAKGTNLIGKVLGNVYGAFSSDRQAQLREQIDFLRRMQGRDFVAVGYKDIGTGYFTAAEGAAKLLEIERQLFDLRTNSAPLGSAARTRALSRGGGSGQLVRTGPTDPGKASPFELDEISVWARPVFNLANEQAAAIKDLNAETLRDTDRFAIQIQNTYHEMSTSMQEDWQAAAEAAENATTGWTAMADEAARAMQGSLADSLFDPFEDGVKGMVANFARAIQQMVAQIMSQQILTSFFSWGASAFGGGVGSFFAAGLKSISPRAIGGPVSGGSPYLVGERGPELFIPGTSGAIVPNGALAGVTIAPVYNVDARGASADLVAALPGILRDSERRTVAAVRDLVGRGKL